ncbi:MAG TPA: CheR family methyltransferase [Verrucomicrobiae bacterium]|nr:CheR family methyltransferase [Verrucomicrobiae bacterium]
MDEKHTLKELLTQLAEELDLDLRGYKHTTLQRRLARRMQQLGLRSYGEYLEFFRGRPAEKNQLLNTVLINVTEFFRDPQAWDYLAHEVLPEQIKNFAPGSVFKVWCAGCSTGEEAYSAAMMVSESLRPRLREYNVKVYATDNDEDALTVARRGEYTEANLRLVPKNIRDKYFTGNQRLRVIRELRKLVIFGRANLLKDSPISHVDLLICRNVLIYFDPLAQRQILSRLRYALNEGGVLFLGKSESQLKPYPDLLPINGQWRIFQRRQQTAEAEQPAPTERKNMDPTLKDKAHQELQTLKLYYQTLLSTLEPGILVMDAGDTIITENENLLKLFGLSGSVVGQKLQDSALCRRCPELKLRLEESRTRQQTIRFECSTSASASPSVAVTLKPILSELRAGRVGTLIYVENLKPRIAIQGSIGELESTSQELQTANAELETTNEELQSTNEELETTNEELQSTNEELETTNEELQSLNEELETTNEGLSARTRELDQVNARYSEMIERMPFPVLLVHEDGSIYMFNSACQELFGFASPSVRGMKIDELPLDAASRRMMIQKYQQVVDKNVQSELLKRPITTNKFAGVVDVHLIPLSQGSSGHGVIVMLQPERNGQNRPTQKTIKSKAEAAKNSQPAKKKNKEKKRK